MINKPEYWKTEKGEIIKITEMTDLHIKNAINYSLRLNRFDNANLLKEEQERRRIQKIKEKSRRSCPFCKGGIMEETEFRVEESEPDIGSFLPEWYHCLTCQKCGAEGPKKKGKL